MCACGCFLVLIVVGALFYSVMHGLWLAATAVVLFAAIVGWFGRKAAGARKGPSIEK
jgi:hypothetical protein